MHELENVFQNRIGYTVSGCKIYNHSSAFKGSWCHSNRQETLTNTIQY